MKPFHYTQCKSKDVSDIKSARKQQANNKVFLENYSFLLNDTKIAIENIESCLNSETELRGRYILMIGGDMSFADDIMGLNPIGNNNSHYRSYLALDETTIIEVRIGNHYETKKAAKEKSNNKSQYLFQVVVSENEPSVPNGSEPIKNVCRVGNLRVLTKKFLSSESSMEDFIEILQSIHDYLILPSKSYEDALSAQTNNPQSTQDATEQNITNNKEDTNMKTENRKRNVVRLTESQLKQMISESVKKVLNEKKVPSYNIDIHFDFAMSVPVKARSLDEAIEIVEEQIYNGTIKPTDAEPTGDYDLDTSYQPDEY